MAIEVRVPTILRSYTGGAKVVEGSGDGGKLIVADTGIRYVEGHVRVVELVCRGAAVAAIDDPIRMVCLPPVQCVSG